MLAGPIQDARRDRSAPTHRGYEMPEAGTLYILRLAEVRASLLVANSLFTRDEWEDIRQELIFDVLCRMPKFDPARGHWEGFVRGVMRNHSSVLHQKRYREARRGVPDTVRKHSGEAGNDPPAEHESLRGSNETHAIDLSLDVQGAISSVPSPLRILAGQLSHMNVAEVCRATGRSRSRVYQMIRQIRAHFLKEGLGLIGQRRKPEPGLAGRRRNPHKAGISNTVMETPTSITRFDSLPCRDVSDAPTVAGSEKLQ